MSVIIIGTGGGGNSRIHVPLNTSQVRLNFFTEDLSASAQTPPSIEYQSSDEGIATVDEHGVVTKVAAGRTIITCVAIRGNFSHTETVELVFLGSTDDFLTTLESVMLL